MGSAHVTGPQPPLSSGTFAGTSSSHTRALPSNGALQWPRGDRLSPIRGAGAAAEHDQILATGSRFSRHMRLGADRRLAPASPGADTSRQAFSSARRMTIMETHAKNVAVASPLDLGCGDSSMAHPLPRRQEYEQGHGLRITRGGMRLA